MIKNALNYLCVTAFLTFSANLHAQTGVSFEKYKSNSEVQQILNSLQQRASSKITIHRITDSPGGEAINVIEIGKDLTTRTIKSKKMGLMTSTVMGDSNSHMFNPGGSYSFVGELFMRSQETYRDDSDKPLAPASGTESSSRRGGNQIKTLKL